MFGMTALTALAGATIAVPPDAHVPDQLERVIRDATAGAWRAVEVMYAAELLRNRLGKASPQVRQGVEALFALVPAPGNFEALAALRAAREAGALEGPLDFGMAIGLARMPHDPQPALAGALSAYPALAAAIDRNVIGMLVEVTRALLHTEPSIAAWTYAPTPYEPALAPFVELVRGPAAAELEALIARPIQLDDNVQFTVYRPRTIDPGKWHPLIAFAHLAERRPGEDDLPDPVEEVQRQAKQVLGERADAYQPVTQDAGASIPAESELTFVPELPGLEVNPPRRSFSWLEPVHREEFRMRATPDLDGKTVRGRLTVFLGAIAIAEISLSIKVDATRPEPVREPSHARTYRKIFASYSHRDLAIVNQFEGYARALGDEYVRDWVHLRTGEVWNDRLLKLIEDADAFQLFWSHNSMQSKFVRQEYEHALSLDRPSFVRPTYWEDPMPMAPGNPPAKLAALHFQKLGGLFTPVGASAEGPRPVGAQIQVPAQAPAPPAAGVCPRCGKENQSHFKFCLGCGFELPSSPAPAGGDMGMMKTMMADPAAAMRPPPRAAAPISAPPQVLAPNAKTIMAQPAPAELAKLREPEVAESLTDVDHEFTPEPAPVPVRPRTITPPKVAAAMLPASRPATSPTHRPSVPPPVSPSSSSKLSAPSPLAPPSPTASTMAPGTPSPIGGAPIASAAPKGPMAPPGPMPIGSPPAPMGGAPMPPPGPMGGMPPAGPMGGAPMGGGPMGPPPGPMPIGSPPAPMGGGPMGGEPPQAQSRLPAGSPKRAGAMPDAAPMGPPPALPGFSPAVPSAAGEKRCPSCGSDVPPAFKFCGSCGFRMDDASAPAPMPVPAEPIAAPQPPQPEVARHFLTLILPDGSEAGQHELTPGKNRLGRTSGPLFHDTYVSPIHVELELAGSTAILRDLESLNGVFVKLDGEEELSPGQIFRIGQELLRFEPLEPRAPSVGETERLGSPNPGYWGKLTVILDDEVSGAAHALLGDAVTLGRSRGEINFSDDAYVSGLHAKVERRDGKVYLSDLGSANGTFVKVTQRQVANGAHILIGQMLFRVTLPTS